MDGKERVSKDFKAFLSKLRTEITVQSIQTVYKVCER